MEVWMTRTLFGCAPADEQAQKALNRHNIGSTFPVDIPTKRTRSLLWHKKYWQLITMLGDNLDQVEVEPGLILPIRNKDDAHLAMRYATGLFDSYAVKGGVIRIVKSTAFDEMTADQWADYWKLALDAVHQKFLPGISSAMVEDEIARMAS